MQYASIGTVARRTGIATSAIRYYERVGVLPPPTRVNGRRRYGDEVFAKLALVRMAQEAGFSIDEVRTLMHGFPEGTAPGERWQELAQRKLPEVEAHIRRMQHVRLVLEESLRCDCLTLDICAEEGWSTDSACEDGEVA